MKPLVAGFGLLLVILSAAACSAAGKDEGTPPVPADPAARQRWLIHEKARRQKWVENTLRRSGVAPEPNIQSSEASTNQFIQSLAPPKPKDRWTPPPPAVASISAPGEQSPASGLPTDPDLIAERLDVLLYIVIALGAILFGILVLIAIVRWVFRVNTIVKLHEETVRQQAKALEYADAIHKLLIWAAQRMATDAKAIPPPAGEPQVKPPPAV
jgi:hypothetical protein